MAYIGKQELTSQLEYRPANQDAVHFRPMRPDWYGALSPPHVWLINDLYKRVQNTLKEELIIRQDRYDRLSYMILNKEFKCLLVSRTSRTTWR